tara:strand:- start:42 stop:359 length:318 start_codon:yes stop_codon:yes gene_type:complete
MSYASQDYEENCVNNYFLLTFLGSVLGEAVSTGDNLVAFSDNSKEYRGDYSVFVYNDYVAIVDDGSILSADKMYEVIGYCEFHGIEYKMNEFKNLAEKQKKKEYV